jgi:hypothetical protein
LGGWSEVAEDVTEPTSITTGEKGNDDGNDDRQSPTTGADGDSGAPSATAPPYVDDVARAFRWLAVSNHVWR